MSTPPQTPDEARRRDLARATGRARAGVDLAEHATGHAAGQIVLALAEGGHEHPDLGIDRLRELAGESYRLSGQSVVLRSRYLELEAAAKVARDADDTASIDQALGDLAELYDDAMAIHAAAEEVRRRLPRIYGDPMNLDPGWPSA